MERDALLAEIFAHPDDDAPRLVYADLLQQQGDPHGEFIAVQCARAQKPDDEVLEAREHELWAKHGAAWCTELGVRREEVSFERGFVRTLTVSAEARVPAALARHPVERIEVGRWMSSALSPARKLRLDEWTRQVPLRELEFDAAAFMSRSWFDPLLAEGDLSALRALHVSSDVPESALLDQALTRVGPLRSFGWMTLSCGRQELERALTSPACRQLRALTVGCTLFPSPPMETVLSALSSSAPPTLRELRLHGAAMPGWRPPQQLETLAWSHGELEPELLAELGPSLRELALVSSLLDYRHLEAMAELPVLRRLDLQDNAFAGGPLETLLSRLGPLEALELSDNPLCLTEMDATLAARFGSARVLGLRGTGLTADGLRQLAEGGAFQQVRELSLDELAPAELTLLAAHAPELRILRTSLSPDALRALQSSPLADRLRELVLTRALAPEDEQTLASVPFRRLRVLGLARGPAKQAHRALMASPWWAGLRRGP